MVSNGGGGGGEGVWRGGGGVRDIYPGEPSGDEAMQIMKIYFSLLSEGL